MIRFWIALLPMSYAMILLVAPLLAKELLAALFARPLADREKKNAEQLVVR